MKNSAHLGKWDKSTSRVLFGDIGALSVQLQCKFQRLKSNKIVIDTTGNLLQYINYMRNKNLYI